MYYQNKSKFFPSYSTQNISLTEIPESGKRFIILLLSYELNFVDESRRVYYYRNARRLKDLFNVHGSLLILPSIKSSIFLDRVKNEISKFAMKFMTYLHERTFAISPVQAYVLEKAYNSLIWEPEIIS